MKKEQMYEVLGDIREIYVCDAYEASNKKSAARLVQSVWVRRWSAIAACLCVAVLVALAAPRLLSLVAPKIPDKPFGNTLSYAGWSDDRSLCDGALNKALLQGEENGHLPIFKMDTLEDLEQFTTAYGGVLSLQSGYDGVLSFEDALSKAQWDREAFYEEHSLLIIYVPSSSGSIRYGVKEVIATEHSICVCVEQKNDPDAFTEDMAGWLILVEVRDEEIGEDTSFDAILTERS